MLAVKIDNPEIENRFKEYAKQNKKDPMKHLHKIEYDYEDDGEDLNDVKLYNHIDDVAQYVHNLRRAKR